MIDEKALALPVVCEFAWPSKNGSADVSAESVFSQQDRLRACAVRESRRSRTAFGWSAASACGCFSGVSSTNPYVADYQSHGPHPVFDYLDQIYMQLNASRVAVGKAPVPLPGAKPWYTVRKWIAGMCTNNPGASVYDLTVTTYQMSVQAMSM